MKNVILQGDALTKLKELPEKSMNMVMTSPPYWALRDYGTSTWDGGSEDCDHLPSNIITTAKVGNTKDGIGRQPFRNICGKCGAKRVDKQLGLEPTFDEYINKLCDIFDEVKRVLRDDGTCWVNIGDTYSGSGCGTNDYCTEASKSIQGKGKNAKLCKTGGIAQKVKEVPSKSLICIPFRFVLEMINRGWILRNTIIWYKPNCMPSSVKDRFTVDFEYIFFFSKKKKYYFETQYEPLQTNENRPFGMVRQREYNYNSKYEGIHFEKKVRQGMHKDRGKNYIEKRELPTQKEIVEFLKEWSNGFEDTLDKEFGEHKWRHWIRLDDSGFSFPSKEDWIILKEMLQFSDKYDKQMLEVTLELDEIKSSVIGRNKRTVWRICPKPFKEAHFACVDSETEMLTENGWRKHNEIKEGDHIFSFNLGRRLIQDDRVLELKKYDYEGELIKVGNRDLDMLLTPNHRVLCLEKNNQIKIRRADKLSEKIKIPINAEFDEYEENEKFDDDFIRLLGWIVTEGNYNSKYKGISIYQNKGENADEIEDILITLRIDYKKSVKNEKEVIFYIGKKSKKYNLIMKFIDKTLQRYIYLPKNQLKILFDILIKADGCKRKDDGRLQYIQKDKLHIDNFQYIALRLGYSCIVSKRKNKNIYQAFLTKRRFIGIRGTNGKGKSIKRIRYKGIVWCPKTRNGTWIARRNGRVFITGNTYPEELCETPIKAGCPEFVCVKCGNPKVKEIKLGEIISTGGSSKGARAKIEWRGEVTEEKQNHSMFTGNMKQREQIDLGYKPTCNCNVEFTGGVVLDPFFGAGTTGLVALKQNKNFLGIELNQEYIEIAEKRLKPFLEQTTLNLNKTKGDNND